MSTPIVTAFDTTSKTLTVTITGRTPDGKLTYTTSPASIEFHAKHATRRLKCRIGSDSIPGTFVFTGYGYAVPNVQVDATGGGTDKLDLVFQFNGQKIDGDLIFQILDETGARAHGSDVDPQVGNDPDPDLKTQAEAQIVKAGTGNGNGSANIATTLTVSTYPDGSFKAFSFSNLNSEGAFEFPLGSSDDTLTVTLAVDRPQYAGRYYIYEYFSSVIAPEASPPPSESGQFGEGTTSVAFTFSFPTTAKDQTYFSVYICDTGTDPSNIYDCDPQVGNDPDPT